MARTVQLGVSDVSFYVRISIEQHDGGGSDTYFSIKKGDADIVFRLEELEPLRAALREAETVLPNLEMALRAATATNAKQPDPAPDEVESADHFTDTSIKVLCTMKDGPTLSYRLDPPQFWLTDGAGFHLRRDWNACAELLSHGLVKVKTRADDRGIAIYEISDRGRAVLAAQEEA